MVLALNVLNEICDRLGWPQIESIEDPNLSAEERKILRLLNRVLKTMTILEQWPLLREQGTMVLVADAVSDVTSGSEQYVTATQNSTTLQVDNIVFDASYVGRHVEVSGYDYVYLIEEVLTDTTVKLNRAWIDASITAADECTFTMGTNRYALPEDFAKPVDDFESFLAPYGISPVAPEEFRAKQRANGGSITVGDPEVYTIFGMNDAQTQQLIHFYPWPDEARLLYFDYIREHPTIDSDNDKILFPNHMIEVVIDMVMQLAYRDYEDDERMQFTLMEMLNKFDKTAARQTVTSSKRVMRPSGNTRRRVYAAYSSQGSGGYRTDWGDTFDRAGNVGFFD